MYFHTVLFIVFFIIVFFGVRFLPRPGWFVFAAGIIFYMMAGWLDTILIFTVIVMNWVFYKIITHGKYRLVVSTIANLGVLAYFKYKGFIFGFDDTSVSYVSIILPLGISFYTFQIIAFQVDAMRGKVLHPPSLPEFGLFISFFPQLIAGPIVRAEQLIPQVQRLFSGQKRRVRLISYGLTICLLGLVKKVFFADSLSPHVDLIFSEIPPNIYYAWLGAWLFTFQIYFDFSGYSDIAVGCAYLLGVHIPFNFRTPYLSLSPQEFWRRWHITLSTWIRDYVYIPMGGSRHGNIMAIAILVSTMSIAGLWHGAGWNFIVWGALWGMYIALVRFIPDVPRFPSSFKWLIHMCLVVVLWVIFRSPDMTYAVQYIAMMLGLGNHGVEIPDLPELSSMVVLGAAVLMALHVGENFLHRTVQLSSFKRMEKPLVWGFIVGMLILTIIIPRHGANPFIYFRF